MILTFGHYLNKRLVAEDSNRGSQHPEVLPLNFIPNQKEIPNLDEETSQCLPKLSKIQK
jgi:hypothetical protein